MKKIDSVTGEEFDCSADAHCWCMDQPRVLSVEQQECVSPNRLEALLKEKNSDTEHGHNAANNGSSLEREV